MIAAGGGNLRTVQYAAGKFAKKGKIDLNRKDQFGTNLFYYALSSGKNDVINWLLGKGENTSV